MILSERKKSSLKHIMFNSPPPGWIKCFKESESAFNLILKHLEDKEYYPSNENIFKAFDLTPLSNVRVVIVGQDPYHGKGQAHGLSFSVNKDCKIPPSLRNIYKEIEREIDDFHMPSHGNLTQWAEQGILMLNNCLTVKPREAGSHKNMWVGFISIVIEEINRVNPDCIFLLWGGKAQKSVEDSISDRAVILTCGHPSPFSVKYFENCGHFKEVNRILTERGEEPIDWQIN